MTATVLACLLATASASASPAGSCALSGSLDADTATGAIGGTVPTTCVGTNGLVVRGETQVAGSVQTCTEMSGGIPVGWGLDAVWVPGNDVLGFAGTLALPGAQGEAFQLVVTGAALDATGGSDEVGALVATTGLTGTPLGPSTRVTGGPAFVTGVRCASPGRLASASLGFKAVLRVAG